MGFKSGLTGKQRKQLRNIFGDRLQTDVPLARFSVMRVGGPADYLVVIKDARDLERSVRFLWEEGIPHLLIGGGANMLISDAGVRKVVLLNQAKAVRLIDHPDEPPKIWAESGASFGILSRRTAAKGWSGLEWAAGIPGTVGGAVVGNAGAHGGDVAGDLLVAEILHLDNNQVRRSSWPAEQFEYDYRYSIIKSGAVQAVVLTATFQLERSTPEEVKTKVSKISKRRQSTQPPGPSLGSMFKNPPGDYAGRLIEEAGLKGTQQGGAQISQLHGNFFLNLGDATAADLLALINLARDTVAEKFNVDLELEILLIGDWEKDSIHG